MEVKLTKSNGQGYVVEANYQPDAEVLHVAHASEEGAEVFWLHGENTDRHLNFAMSLSDVTDLYNALGEVVAYYEANGVTLN